MYVKGPREDRSGGQGGGVLPHHPEAAAGPGRVQGAGLGHQRLHALPPLSGGGQVLAGQAPHRGGQGGAGKVQEGSREQDGGGRGAEGVGEQDLGRDTQGNGEVIIFS